MRTDSAHFFKKLRKKLDKGILSMMAASCVLEVYMAHHKPSTEGDKDATATDDSKYVQKLTQGLIIRLGTDLANHTTVANISAFVTCLRMMRIGGAVDAKCLDVAKGVTLARVHSATLDPEVDSAASVLHFLSAGFVSNMAQINVAAASWCIYHERASGDTKSIVERGLADVVALFSSDDRDSDDVDVVRCLWQVFQSHIHEPTVPLLAALDGLRVVIKSCREGGIGVSLILVLTFTQDVSFANASQDC